jgi:uracil phosphoribosyltransferase
MPQVHESSHPIVLEKIGQLRDTRTGPAEFRRLVRSLAMLLGYEATADLAQTDQVVTTPLGPCPARRTAERLMVVPILRAGLGMVDGLLDLVPDAEVWHLGMFRDEATLTPTEYYNKLPARVRASQALVVDPMLATGGSAVRACALLRRAGVGRIKLLALIAAPEGIRALAEAEPDVAIHVAAIDARLNEVGFIYPGLGDAGDRQFGTAHD